MGGMMPAQGRPMDLPEGYRAMFMRGMFSSDPVIQQLIAQITPRVGPSVGAVLTPGAGLPEMLPPEVARDVRQAPVVGADPVVQAVLELLQQIANAVAGGLEGTQGGEPGGGGEQGGGQQGGGQQGGGQQGGGQQGGGQQGSPEFEADIDFGRSDLYG